jgi:hypothetical protein
MCRKYDPLDMAPGAISPPRGEGKKHNCLPGSVSSFVQGESRGEDLRKSIYAEGGRCKIWSMLINIDR